MLEEPAIDNYSNPIVPHGLEGDQERYKQDLEELLIKQIRKPAMPPQPNLTVKLDQMQSYLKWKEEKDVTTELIRNEDTNSLD